jgi:RNA recognition motif-containing protein
MSDAAPLPPADAMQGVLSTAAPIPGVPLTIPVVSPPELAPPANSLTPNMESESVEPEYACETLYIQNLNEKIKINVLKATLRSLFKSYGEVVDVVAHSNLRMRGQAFVSFSSKESAQKALKDVQRFPLYSKPMQISFARSWSDAVVKKLDPQNYDKHKAARDERKKETRYTNPLKQKLKAKRMMDGTAAFPAPRRPNVQMPDEYLPPNKILFLQNLPESVTKEQLTSLFSQYPNLSEVRLIPTKRDIAFVEYFDEGSATVAKDALHNYKLDGENKIKITFARK